MSKGSAHNIIKNIAAMLLKLNVHRKIIAWPTTEQKERTKNYFLRNGIPGELEIIQLVKTYLFYIYT